jgi:formate-dependent nitrite reductase membrane component NrfD
MNQSPALLNEVFLFTDVEKPSGHKEQVWRMLFISASLQVKIFGLTILIFSLTRPSSFVIKWQK